MAVRVSNFRIASPCVPPPPPHRSRPRFCPLQKLLTMGGRRVVRLPTDTPGEFVDVPVDAKTAAFDLPAVAVSVAPGRSVTPPSSLANDVLVLTPCYPVHSDAEGFTMLICSGLVMRLRLGAPADGPQTAFIVAP